jgi:hypothetical protein
MVDVVTDVVDVAVVVELTVVDTPWCSHGASVGGADGVVVVGVAVVVVAGVVVAAVGVTVVVGGLMSRTRWA